MNERLYIISSNLKDIFTTLTATGSIMVGAASLDLDVNGPESKTCDLAKEFSLKTSQAKHSYTANAAPYIELLIERNCTPELK